MITQLFPNSDFALRIPSVIFGLTSVYLLFILGRRLFNTKVGLIASFMLAISPFHIWYSQELRSYSLLMLLTTISVYYFWLGLHKNKKKYWIGYLISTLAALYTHSYFRSVVIVQNIYYLFHILYA